MTGIDDRWPATAPGLSGTGAAVSLQVFEFPGSLKAVIGVFGLLLATASLALAFVVLRYSDGEPIALAGGVVLLAFAGWMAWSVLDVLRRRLIVTSSHVSERTGFGRTTAIAWTEIADIEWDPKAGFKLVSVHGEVLRVHSLLGGDEFGRRVQQHVSPNLAQKLVGAPGFEKPRPLTAMQKLHRGLAVLVISVVGLMADNIDWRDADRRCAREGALSALKLRTGRHRSCLELACEARDQVWLAALLKGGADPNRQDKQRNNAMHKVAALRFPEGAELLAAAGGDPLARNLAGDTAVDVALQHKDYTSIRAMLDGSRERISVKEATGLFGLALQAKDTELQVVLQRALADQLPVIADPDVEKQYVALLLEADAALAKGDYETAYGLAERAVALDPASARDTRSPGTARA